MHTWSRLFFRPGKGGRKEGRTLFKAGLVLKKVTRNIERTDTKQNQRPGISMSERKELNLP